ncbi:MAG: FtsW/RodA/SpoVE family cell cycle protein, partial [Gammaproteobacteria bacterium]
MVGIDRRLLQNVDWLLLAAAGGLVSMSVVTLANVGVGRAGSGVAFRQLVWIGVGFLALLAVASLDYRRLVRMAPLLYVLGLAGLCTVFVLGRTVSGARRWIVLGPLSVQPSEVFKLAFVLILVWWLTSRWAVPLGTLTLGFMVPIIAVPFVLVVKQPDLGTALLFLPVTVALLVGAGVRLRMLSGLVLAGLAGLPLAWLVMKDY